MTLALRVFAPSLFAAVLMFVPLSMSAQTLPDPIIRMSEAAADSLGSRTTTNVYFSVYDSGEKTYQGSARGTFSTGAGDEADAEGSFTFTLEEIGSSDLKDYFGKSKLTIGLDFKVLTTDEIVYFRISKLPKIAEFDLKKITKKWMYVEVGEDASEYSSKADISSREILEHFSEAYRKYPAITFTEQGSTSREYVYNFRANPVMFMRLVNEAYRLAGEDPIFTSSDFSEFGNHLDTVKGTYRISKTSFLPTMATYRLDYSDGTYRLAISADTKYQYGPIKRIKKPAGAVSLERLMEDLFGDLDDAREKGNDAALKSNLSYARAEAELYYDSYNSYEGVCATRGYNVIGDNVASAASATGKGKGECNDTAYDWAASARLSSGKYYCVDSTGFAGEVRQKLGSDTVCS